MTVVDGKSRQDIIPCLMATSLCPGSSPLGLLAPTAASAPVALLSNLPNGLPAAQRPQHQQVLLLTTWLRSKCVKVRVTQGKFLLAKSLQSLLTVASELDAASTCLQRDDTNTSPHGETQKWGLGFCIKLGFHKLDPNSLTTFSLVRRQVKTRLSL